MRKSVLVYGVLLFTLGICACIKESEKFQQKNEKLHPQNENKVLGNKDQKPDLWLRNEHYCKLR